MSGSTGGLRAGPAPTPAQLRHARSVRRALATELGRVRDAALAWRNGLGAVLAGLIGFSLIKGRNDVGQIASHWAVVAGLLLLGALVVGAWGVLALLRAAHGRPSAARVVASPGGAVRPFSVEDHDETLASARSLRIGITLTCLCTALLAAAVGVTWYAPPKDPPQLLIRQGGTTLCGTPTAAARGTVVLKVNGVTSTVDLAGADSVTPVASCPARLRQVRDGTVPGEDEGRARAFTTRGAAAVPSRGEPRPTTRPAAPATPGNSAASGWSSAVGLRCGHLGPCQRLAYEHLRLRPGLRHERRGTPDPYSLHRVHTPPKRSAGSRTVSCAVISRKKPASSTAAGVAPFTGPCRRPVRAIAELPVVRVPPSGRTRENRAAIDVRGDAIATDRAPVLTPVAGS